MTSSIRSRLPSQILVVAVTTLGLFACHASVRSGPPEEHCRTVKVHNRGEVQECHTRCHDDTCRTQCREHERVSRERRCWVD